MINLNVSGYCRQEKEYICAVLFQDILGQKERHYALNLSSAPENPHNAEWSITGPKGTLVFPDLFKHPYTVQDIPKEVPFLTLPRTPEKDIPAIFHKGEYSQKGNRHYIPVDIFASAFFMVSRWEEPLVDKASWQGRLPASAALAAREKFLLRPVVNEYAFWLASLLESTGLQLPAEPENKNIFIPTHDVDMIRFGKLKRYAGDILKYRSPNRFIYRLTHHRSNPWNTFEWLMDESERAGVRSRFYILPRGKNIMDKDFSLNDPLARSIIRQIQQRGHILGIHPSFSAADNQHQWNREKKRLERILGHSVTEGRQHYLRWYHDKTPHYWESAGMQIDSTLGYYNQPGYRCGTGNEFTLYNIAKRRPYRLKERPLVFMEGTVKDYLKEGPREALNYLGTLKTLSKKYNMPLTILFHNSSFDELTWPGWKEAYKEFISENSYGYRSPAAIC